LPTISGVKVGKNKRKTSKRDFYLKILLKQRCSQQWRIMTYNRIVSHDRLLVAYWSATWHPSVCPNCITIDKPPVLYFIELSQILE